MTTQMLINYAPSEACRVAIVADGKLEEYHAEPTDRVSRVNNVYVGRVTNVEPAIQAAFVDFGIEDNGFLHISDLHPMYFPKGDDETTERVGKKTPRRERPPIQACLKRGQEIIVQVIKEGVGTKGPTLTSYLSIPGRFLVMMPQMDPWACRARSRTRTPARRCATSSPSSTCPRASGSSCAPRGLTAPRPS